MSNNPIEDEKNQPNVDDLISLKRAAELSELSYSHWRYLARNGEVWAKKLGRDWVTTEKAVQDYLSRDRRPGPKT